MDRIRVLLAEMPQMLRDVFKQLVSEQPDMEIVGDLSNRMELLLAASETHADIVILRLDNSELPGVCSHLLSEIPRIKLLGITADTRRAFLHELRPHKVPISDASPQGLLDAIRASARCAYES